jgi:putative phosphoesterase
MPRLGLIADTHGLLRPQALVALEGCDRILHAGDVGEGDILEALGRLAPVVAVAGNCDDRPDLPAEARLSVGGVRILLRHGHLPEEAAPEADVVVSGHTHVPLVAAEGGRLRVNPGSAGPRRFRLPVTVGILLLGEGAPRAEIVELDLGP